MTSPVPTSQNFESFPQGPVTLPATFDGLVFDTNTISPSSTLLALPQGTQGLLMQGSTPLGIVPTFSFHSVALTDNFQLTSLLLGGASAGFTVTGYNDGNVVASDTIVLDQSDSAGSVTYTFTPGVFGTTLNFSSAWTGIDTVTFAGGTAASPEFSGFGLAVDDIVLQAVSGPTFGLAPGSDSGTLGDNITNVTSPVLTGTATPGATVDIYLDGGLVPIGSFVADSKGVFTVADPGRVWSDGTSLVTAKEQGDAGAGTTIAITVDTQVVAPAGLALAVADVTDYTPTVTGTAESNATVTLYDTDGTTVIGTTVADGKGEWAITTAELGDGVHNLVAKQVDAAGNASAASIALAVTVTTGRPGAPVLDAATDSGVQGDSITSYHQPTLTGVATASSLIRLYDGEVAIGQALSDAAGKWSIVSNTVLADGEHLLRAGVVTAMSRGAASAAASAAPAGGVAETVVKGAPLALIIDSLPPKAPTDMVLAPASDSGVQFDNSTLDNTPTITGTAEADSTVYLYDGHQLASRGSSSIGGPTLLGTVVADGKGHWSITSTTLSTGVHNLAAYAEDAAGNREYQGAFLDLTIEAAPVTPPTPTGPGTSTTVDGVTVVTTPVTLPGGGSGTSTAVPIVTTGRVEQSGGSTTADIPLAAAAGATLLTAQVHTGAGLTASGGVSQGAAASLEQLIAAIRLTGGGSSDVAPIAATGTSFLSFLPQDGALLVHTVKLAGTGDANGNLVDIVATPGAVPTAIVLDATQIAGGTVTLHDVQFSAVFGALSVVTDTTGQIVTGDSASQKVAVGTGAGGTILLGGGADTLQFGIDGAAARATSAAADPAAAATTVLHGGLDADVAVFAGAAADFTVAQHDGYVLVSRNAMPAQVAKLVNVESLQFTDRTATVDSRVELDTLAGLYGSILGRQADVGGFDYWGGIEQGGGSLGTVALSIVTSVEGAARLGGLNGEAAHDVELLYRAFFERASDAGGKAYWLEQMANGATLEQVADAMVHAPEIIGHQVADTGWNFFV